MEVQTLFGRLASDKEESLAHVLDGQVRRAAGLDAETRRTARGHGATWTPRRTARAWTARRDGRRELGRRDGPAGELWAWTGCGAGRRDETDGEGPASHLDGPRGELWAWTGCGATLDAETGQRAAWTGCGATWTPRRATEPPGRRDGPAGHLDAETGHGPACDRLSTAYPHEIHRFSTASHYPRSPSLWASVAILSPRARASLLL